MASKDKGGRQSKKAPARNLKEKRSEKRAKKDAGNHSRVVSA